MVGVFIHDHIFIENAGLVYTSGTLNYQVLSRYLKNVDTLRVVGRRKQTKASSKEVLASGERVSFALVDAYRSNKDLLTSFRSIYRFLLKEIADSDFVIIRLPSVLGLIAAYICRRKRKCYMLEVVGCIKDALYNYGSTLARVLSFPLFYLNRYAIKRSKFVVYVTKTFLQARYPTNGISTNISNVEIACPRVSDLEKRQQTISMSCIAKDHVWQIGMIGNVELRYKGYEVALKALNELKKKGVLFKLIIVGGGDGEYINNLVKEYNLADKVSLRGKLPSDLILDFLRSIDIYWHPSLTEGLPRTVIEAMSVGCPILASNVGGIPELLPSYYLHSPNDYIKLVNDFESNLNTQDLAKMSRDNFEVSKEYSKGVLDLRREEYIKNVIKYNKA